MKHVLKILAILVLIPLPTIYAQAEYQDKPIRYLFKMSPQHLTFSMLKIGMEKFNKERTSSIQLYIQGIANDNREEYIWDTGYNGGGAEIMLKKYVLPIQVITTRRGRHYTQGIYLGGFIQGGYYKANSEGEYVSWNPITQMHTAYNYDYQSQVKNMAGGFTIGIQQVYWKVLTVDAYIGAGLQSATQNITGNAPDWATEAYNFTDIIYAGVLPKIGLTLGVVL